MMSHLYLTCIEMGTVSIVQALSVVHALGVDVFPIVQLGEFYTEDLKVLSSIPDFGIFVFV